LFWSGHWRLRLSSSVIAHHLPVLRKTRVDKAFAVGRDHDHNPSF
jgi:hypothetical protein